MKNVTTQQKNIWDLQRYYPQTGISNLCGAIVYHEKRDSRLLELALEETVRANDALRLRFTDEGGCRQYLSTEPVLIENRRFADEAELDRYAHETAGSPVSLQDSAMCSFTVFEMGSRSGILAKMNHLIADAWSFGLIADEVEGIYGRLCREGKPGEHAGLPAESETAEKGPYSYLTYAEEDLQYRESDRYQRDRAYWQSKYLSRPEETRIKLSEGNPVSVESGRIIKELPEFLSSGIGTYCRQHGITEAVLFESAVLIYLARTCRNETGITIGLPVLNRNRLSEKKTVGMFISTMPLTVKAGKDDTLEELYKKILTAKREMYRHHRFPYEDILQMLRKQHDFQGSLYDVMVSVQNTEIHGTGSFYTKWYDSGYSEVPLTVSFDRRDGQARYTVTMDYQKSVITEEETELLYERIVHILVQMTGESGTGKLMIGDIDILAAGEKEKLLYTFNDTHVEYPEERCVHELFSEQAKRTPDREALVFEGERFTYRQLDEMSNSLAHYLRSEGIGRGDIVPIIAKRDWRIIAAMLGILKAGGAYMPVSPEYPAERIGGMLEAAECKIALCFRFDNLFPIKSVDLGRFDFQSHTGETLNTNDPDDICYVIFTSGSTGAPKGCPIFHRGFVNTLSWRIRNYYNRMDSVVCVSPFFTDTFEEDVFTALLSGRRILFVGDNHNLNCIREAAFTAKEKSSIMTTPTFFKSILSAMPEKKWESVILVGEALTEQHRSLFMANTGSLHNEYGPSECSICATYRDVTCLDDPVTIGRPVANTQIYILDGEQQLLPIGVAGELCIAGAGVGKGYLNRPELTAERFIANPYAAEENHHGKVLYRTGDLARWRPDGEIEYLGRIDTQVKIRGLRIELGEIESAMSEAEGIGLTAVAAQKDESGRQYLAGYYTAEGEVSEKELRKHLSEKLPRYMVPNYFMRLEKMPVTASGKTDRRNLPVPEMRLSEREYTAPETEMEKLFCSILEDILSIERVGTTDDFFEIGGDSLGAITFVSKAHDLGIEIRIQDVYEYPTVLSLTGYLQEESGEGRKKDSSRKEWGRPLNKGDFEKYTKILSGNRKDHRDGFERRDLGNILLTGATGFLGAHILSALMKEETGKVYCLMREKEGQTKDQRLAQTLEWYFGDEYRDMIGRRIIAVSGDIDQEGLSKELPEGIGTVIHTAAIVKHYGPYSEFRKANVAGTGNVAAFAERTGAELIHISTASVSGRAMEETDRTGGPEEGHCFGETDLYIGQNLDNVYIRSKFEAERLVMDRMLTGRLKAKIVRVGNLTNRVRDYRFQPNYMTNAFLRRMKAILELGKFPDSLLGMSTEFSPVDLTAEGIVNIAQHGGDYTVFHLYNNRPLRNDRMLQIMSDQGIGIEAVPEEEFITAVEGTLHEEGRAYIYESLQDELRRDGVIPYGGSIHVVNDFSVWFLEKCGFVWDDIDENYLKGYIDYYRKIGYLNV